MALDGIVMANIQSELNDKLVNGRITKIYQPEGDELLLVIKNNKDTYRLLISAQASLPLIYLTEDNKVNPMTPPNFCMLLRKHINNGRITAIHQPSLERIIEIHIEHMNEMGDLCTKKLIVEIMGRHSNIIFCDQENRILDSIKHISQNISSVREVLPGRHYQFPPDQNKLNPLTIDQDSFVKLFQDNAQPLYKILYTSLTGISPLIAQEICYRTKIDGTSYSELLSEDDFIKLYGELKHLVTIISDKTFEPTIIYHQGVPEEFSSIPLGSFENYDSKSFDSISEVLDTFYGTKALLSRIKQKSTDIRKTVNNALDRAYKKQDLQLNQLKDTEKRDKYKIYGELILAFAYNLQEGQDKLIAYNYYNNDEEITIPLDPTLTSSQNAQKYYERYNKLKRTFDALQEQLEETKKELQHLESINNALDIAENENDLLLIRKELVDSGYIKRKLKDKKTNHLPSKPLHYLSSDGFHIYVGKNNFQNEDLSLKFAANDDWWFHTKEVPGSHVIVKTNHKELPDKTYEEAAALAAYYSKARESTKVAVDYTLKKNLKKPNGSKPGFVIYHTNYTVYVEPSIKGLQLIKD